MKKITKTIFNSQAVLKQAEGQCGPWAVVCEPWSRLDYISLPPSSCICGSFDKTGCLFYARALAFPESLPPACSFCLDYFSLPFSNILPVLQASNSSSLPGAPPHRQEVTFPHMLYLRILSAVPDPKLLINKTISDSYIHPSINSPQQTSEVDNVIIPNLQTWELHLKEGC